MAEAIGGCGGVLHRIGERDGRTRRVAQDMMRAIDLFGCNGA